MSDETEETVSLKEIIAVCLSVHTVGNKDI
jgi:hypothetical protein